MTFFPVASSLTTVEDSFTATIVPLSPFLCAYSIFVPDASFIAFAVIVTGRSLHNPCLSSVMLFFEAHFCVSVLIWSFVNTIIVEPWGGAGILLFSTNAAISSFHEFFGSVCLCWYATAFRTLRMSSHSSPVSLCWDSTVVTFGDLRAYSSDSKNHFFTAFSGSIGGI